MFSIVRPKRRHLVVGDFIRACAEEDTLLDEDGELEDFKDVYSFWYLFIDRQDLPHEQPSHMAMRSGPVFTSKVDSCMFICTLTCTDLPVYFWVGLSVSLLPIYTS